MPVNQLIEKFKKEGMVIVDNFKAETMGVRSNRPHPALIENIKVESPIYGSTMPLKHLSTIQVSLPNNLIVQVWDKNNVSACVKAIEMANLGVSTSIEGNQIRVILPPLSQERRDQIFQLIKKKSEDTKIELRVLRDNVLKEAKKMYEDKELSEDNKYKIKEDLQKTMDDFGEEIEKIIEEKKKEIYE